MSGGNQSHKLNRLLDFSPEIAARFEKDHGAERILHVRRIVLIALLLFNSYNLIDWILLPDLSWTPTAMRTLAVTPFGLVVFWMAGRLDPVWRERALLFGCFGALSTTLVFLNASRAEISLHSFGELGLAIIFANMMALLRFPHAVLFTLIALAASGAVLMSRADADYALKAALFIQLVTACIFSLYGNYMFQSRTRRDYLRNVVSEQRAEIAEREGSKLLSLARTDVVTQMPNRRALQETFADWFKSDDRITVMMIDLDYFKLFNDRLGHLAGDDCLKQIGTVLNAATAGEDMFAARYGGEEFVVALRNIGENGAQSFARALVRAVEVLAIRHPGGIENVVTISVGVASRKEAERVSGEKLLASADEALYAAKRKGRNRVEIAGPTNGTPRFVSADQVLPRTGSQTL